MRPDLVYNKVRGQSVQIRVSRQARYTSHQSSFRGGGGPGHPACCLYCPKGETEAPEEGRGPGSPSHTLPSSSPQRPHHLVLPPPAALIPSRICSNALGPQEQRWWPRPTMLIRRLESPPHRVMQMRRPEAPPLAPSLSLRGSAGPTESPISASARRACRPSVRPAARVTSKRSGGSGGDSLDPVRERGLGRPLLPPPPLAGFRSSVCLSGQGSVSAGRVPCGSSPGRGRGGSELGLADRVRGGERGEGTPDPRSQAAVVRVTVIVWLSLCISVWLCNCNCVALAMPVWRACDCLLGLSLCGCRHGVPL